MFDLKQGILNNWTYKLFSKKLIWSKKIRIFCDGGSPRFTWYPLFRANHYASYWNMTGFVMVLWGREVFFSFGEDINGLYKEIEK